MATLIDGKATAETIRNEVKTSVSDILTTNPSFDPPGLTVIIVGERKDSQTYVKLKHQAATECGIISTKIELPEDVPQSLLEETIRSLNNDPKVHGILVQLPLPPHVNEAEVLDLIAPEKDVDGLHPMNVGLMHSKKKQPFFLPCTPLGCIELLKRYKIPIAGRRAVVVGRSNIVGLPVSHLLLQENATVTVCHSKSVDTDVITREADILIAACGQAGLIRGSWIKPGAAVIDVGTNAVPDTTKKTGFRLVGDVDFNEAVKVAGFITPVPGGVGPMTIAMLLTNTLRGYKRCHNIL